MVGTYLHFTSEELLPTTNLPFACDAGGNFFLMDRVTGRVWFMPINEWKQEDTLEQNWPAPAGRSRTASRPSWTRSRTRRRPGHGIEAA